MINLSYKKINIKTLIENDKFFIEFKFNLK